MMYFLLPVLYVCMHICIRVVGTIENLKKGGLNRFFEILPIIF